MAHALNDKVVDIINSNPITIFMKGTVDFPQCGFSNKACQVLKMAGVKNIKSVDILADEQLWEALEDHTQWFTVPQVFINGKFVGGCDIVSEMFERGELQDLVKQVPNA